MQEEKKKQTDRNTVRDRRAFEPLPDCSISKERMLREAGWTQMLRQASAHAPRESAGKYGTSLNRKDAPFYAWSCILRFRININQSFAFSTYFSYAQTIYLL